MPKLSYSARRRWSLVILLIGLPVWIVVAVSLVNLLDRPPFAVELAIYVVLGFLWMLPLRSVFRGIGCDDPDGISQGGYSQSGTPRPGRRAGASAGDDEVPGRARDG